MKEFDKIIGYEREKQELMQICDILKRPEEYMKFGIRAPKGILLEGVPGVGKTSIAWALIKESGLKYFHCKKDKPDGEFVNVISKTFEEAKDNAPSIIFLDDVDKFAEVTSRDSSNQEEFVAIQTGMETIKNSSVLVLATANDIYVMPESLKRSGRFDKVFNIQPPTKTDTIKIVRHYLSSKKVSATVKAEDIAKMIDGHSCADLENVLNEAGIYAVYHGFSEILPEHITNAIASLIHGINIYERPHTTEKLKMVAYHEAGHTVMAYLSKTMEPAITTIYKGKDKLGLTVYSKKENDCSQLEDSLDRIKCGLGGAAAQEIVFGYADIGTSSDYQKAYELLEEILTRDCYKGFEYIYFHDDWDKRVPTERLNNIASKISTILNELYLETKETLIKNKTLLDNIATTLIEKKILAVNDFEKLQ